jgi:hypothetical protein
MTDHLRVLTVPMEFLVGTMDIGIMRLRFGDWKEITVEWKPDDADDFERDEAIAVREAEVMALCAALSQASK